MFISKKPSLFNGNSQNAKDHLPQTKVSVVARMRLVHCRSKVQGGFEPRFNPGWISGGPGGGKGENNNIGNLGSPGFNPGQVQPRFKPRFNPGSTWVQPGFREPRFNLGSTWAQPFKPP